jgi:hypothetical protein
MVASWVRRKGWLLLTDKDNQNISGLMLIRSQVSQYIPQEIKNKKQIIPIIEDMTRELLDTYLPQNILMQTAEPITGDSLIRYQQLINIMVSEYGYILNKTEKSEFGTTSWFLNKEKHIADNKDMNETYIIKHQYTLQENVDRFYLPIINQILPIENK